MKELTPKQQLFCDEYLIDKNASRAALKAGYSRATALSGQLMRFPKIKAYLAERTEAIQQKVRVTQEMVIEELAKVAFADAADFFGADGKLKPMNEVSDKAKAGLWNLKISEKDGETTVTIRMHNKMAALGKLMSYFDYAPAPQPEVKYVYLDKANMDAFDRFDDSSFDEPKEEEEENDETETEAEAYENNAARPESQEEIENREVREKEIHAKAVRETEMRCKREFDNEVMALKRHYDELEEKRLKEEAKKVGVPSKLLVEMMKRRA
jgi:hypothetical protein